MANADPRHYQPTNIVFGIRPAAAAADGKRVNKGDRKMAVAERALAELDARMASDSRGTLQPQAVNQP